MSLIEQLAGKLDSAIPGWAFKTVWKITCDWNRLIKVPLRIVCIIPCYVLAVITVIVILILTLIFLLWDD